MNRLSTLLILLSCLLCACATTDSLKLYQYDLVSMMHNTENGYTLLVYHDGLGEARHVLRREGICEVVITYAANGAIKLQERGRQERRIDAYEAGQWAGQITVLLRESGSSSSTSDI